MFGKQIEDKKMKDKEYFKERENSGEDNSLDPEIYQENILELYKRPQNKFALLDYTIKQRKDNLLCGDWVVIYLKIKKRIIHDAAFEGDGCAISQAAASLLTEKMKNQPLQSIQQMTEEEAIKMLGIPISYLRRKCALLPLLAVKEGIQNSIKKVENSGQNVEK